MTRSTRLSLVAAVLGLSALGCHDFKYFDVHVKFDPLTFSTTTVHDISFCKVTVSGADSSSFRIDNCPPPPSALLDGGVFTFSSFADSGTMNFKLDTYTGIMENPACISGSGMTSVPVAGPTTIAADLTVSKTGAGCTSVTPVNDGSM